MACQSESGKCYGHMDLSVFLSKTALESSRNLRGEEDRRDAGLCFQGICSHTGLFEQITPWLFDLRIKVFAEDVL